MPFIPMRLVICDLLSGRQVVESARAIITGLVIAASVGASAAQKPGTFGYADMPWIARDRAPAIEQARIGLNQPVRLATLAPLETHVLTRDLVVRKRHLIAAGTVFGRTRGSPLTLCEVERRPEANYVECFAAPDAAGAFAEHFPVSLSVAYTTYVSRQSYFIGRRYFDSKKPLAQPVSLADFKPLAEFGNPFHVYLNLARIDPAKPEVQLEFCSISQEDLANGSVARGPSSCATRIKLDGNQLPMRFITPFGGGQLHAVAADAITLSFTPVLPGAGA